MSFAVPVAALLLFAGVPWVLFAFNAHQIENQLDQRHDYFRYFDREMSRSLGGSPTLGWLKDFMAKYSRPEFDDPILDGLVEKQRQIRSIQIASGIAWAGLAFVWMMVAN